MISRTDLQEIARFKRLSIRNAERDYFLDLCLQTVSRHGHGLVFKGGTALYKLHNLNRFSEDLDFSTEKRTVDLRDLQSEIVRSARLLGISAHPGEPEEHQQGTNLLISFNGPLYDGSKGTMTRVVFNLSLRERPQFIETKMYVPLYKELGSFELKVLRADELLAEKVRAVLTRDKPRDIYDVWFLLNTGVRLDQDLTNKKLKAYGRRFEVEGFLTAAQRKRGMWASDLRDLLIGELPKFDSVLREIRSFLK